MNISTLGNGFLEFEGTVDLGAAARTFTFTEDSSDVCFMGEITGTGGLNLVMSGSGLSGTVMFCGPDHNTYAGLTTVGAGVRLELQKDPGVTAIAGDLTVESGGAVSIVETSEQINPTSTVTINGILGIFAGFSGTTTQTIGNLQGTGSITNAEGPSILKVNAGNFAGTILDGGADPLSVVKNGPGTLTLSGASAYRGGTTINAGTLVTTNATALGDVSLASAPVILNGGTLAPVGTLTISTLDWTGGTIASLIGTNTSFLEVTGDLNLTGVGTFEFTADAGFLGNTPYAILSAANLASFTTGSFAGTSPLGLTPIFTLTGDTLYVSFQGASNGAIIQNSGPVFTPTNANFFVNGAVQTGDPTQSNIINSLTFAAGSSVTVFNNLTVTSGNFTVPVGSAVIQGGRVVVPGTFNLIGGGTLIAGSQFVIGGDANINGGSLVVNNLFTAAGNMNVFSTVTVNGNAQIGGNLNTDGSQIIVNGIFGIGGAANLNNATTLVVNGGGLLTAGQAVNIGAGSAAQINGQLTAPQITNNGLLQGTGVIAGNVWNNGIVAPGNSPGTLTVNGNYAQTPNGTLQIELGDLLFVTGNAGLAGRLQLLGTSGLKYGQQIVFLQAGSISGEFDEVRVPNPSRNRGRVLINAARARSSSLRRATRWSRKRQISGMWRRRSTATFPRRTTIGKP